MGDRGGSGGEDAKQASLFHCMAIKNQEVILAAEARDPRPTPGSLAQGTRAGKKCPHNTLRNHQGLHLSETKAYWRPRGSSRGACIWTHSKTHSPWAPVEGDQLKKHQGHTGRK